MPLRNGWTGGQYSLFRAIFGLYVAMCFLQLSTSSGALSWAAASGLSILLAIGLYDRAAAPALLCLLVFLHRSSSLLASLGLFPAHGLLLVHAFTPAAPYGAWAARGRPDPGGSWRMPQPVYLAGWLLLAFGYAGIIYTGRFGLLVLAGLVMLHLFTFDPGWIRPRTAAAQDQEILFYDGHCGLCHRGVRFVLSEDRAGSTFRFSPLGSDLFNATVSETQRRGLPDTIVLRTSEGLLLTKSTAVVYILGRLGGFWRIIGGTLDLLPAKVSDGIYDAVARARHRLFRAPADACPVVPGHLRARFHL